MIIIGQHRLDTYPKLATFDGIVKLGAKCIVHV